MIYHDPNDAERGYFDEEAIIEMACDEWGFEPAPCSVCGCVIPAEAVHPLCRRCEGTARATAKAFPAGPSGYLDERESVRRLKR